MCLNMPTLNSIRSTSKHFAIVIENLKNRKALKREDLHALRVVKAYLLSFLHIMLRYQHLFQHRWFMNSQTHFCGVNAGVFHFLAKNTFKNLPTKMKKWRKEKLMSLQVFPTALRKKKSFQKFKRTKIRLLLKGLF